MAKYALMVPAVQPAFIGNEVDIYFSLSQFDYNDILKNESAPVHALSTENPRSLSDKIIELNSGSTIGFFPSG